MSIFPKRTTRIVAGALAGALALSVTPILGLVGTASAADPLPPLAEPIGAGNFCEDAPATEPFTDVSATDPSLDEIICLVATELTQGTTPTTYSPNAAITRRQMALFIKRTADLANELEVTALTALPAYDGIPDFIDIVGESPEAQEAIGQLSQADIVQGTTAATYGPGQNVTRRQMAAFINRLQDFLTGDPFTTTGDFFDDDTGDTGEANLNAVASVGIFQGDGAGNVDPGGNLTRRQMANVLLRYAQVLFDAGDIEGAFTAGPPVDETRPLITDARVTIDASLQDRFDAGDVVTLTFNEDMADDIGTGAVFVLTDGDGDTFNLSCSATVACVLSDDAANVDRVLTMTVLASIADTNGPGDGLLEMPATITTANASVRDQAGNVVDLVTSTDVVVDKAAGPPVDETGPFITDARVTADANLQDRFDVGDVVTLTFNEDMADDIGTTATFVLTDGDGDTFNLSCAAVATVTCVLSDDAANVDRVLTMTVLASIADTNGPGDGLLEMPATITTANAFVRDQAGNVVDLVTSTDVVVDKEA